MSLPFGINALTRTERIADIPFSANTAVQLPTQSGNIPTDRFLHSLVLEFRGRMTNPSSPNEPTGTVADAPFSVIERIEIEGYHRVRGRNEKFIDVRGADLRRLCSVYYTTSQFVSPSSLVLTADATNDIRFFVDIPFVPLKMPARQQCGWLLDAPNYDSLRLTVRFADDNSVFTGQVTPVPFTAFGSASGSPTVRVSGRFVMAGASKFAGFLPGRVWRYFQDNQAGEIVSGGNALRLFNIPRGNMIRGMLLKTGAKSAAASSGNTPYATLSDGIATNLKLYRGINKIIRDYNSFGDVNNDIDMAYATNPTDGYALIDFVENGEDQEIFDLRSAVAGPTGDVDTYLQADVAAGANQIMTLLYEEWRGRPVGVA